MIKINEIFRILNYLKCHTNEYNYVTLEYLSEKLNIKPKKIKLCIELLKEAGVFNITKIEEDVEDFYYYQDSFYSLERYCDDNYSVYSENIRIGTIRRIKLSGNKYTFGYSYKFGGLEAYYPCISVEYIEKYYDSIQEDLDWHLEGDNNEYS